MLEQMPNFARNTMSMVQVSNLTTSNKHVYICNVYKHIYVYIYIYIYYSPRLEGLHLAMHKNPGAATMLSSRAEGSARLHFPPATSMWIASPLGTTPVSLPRGFLSYKTWITKMFSKKKHWWNHKTLQHQKNMRLHQSAIYIFASLHLCATPFCSGNVPHSSSCLSWHPGSCKEENDLQPVSLFYHGPDGCIYLVTLKPHVWTPSIGISHKEKNIIIYIISIVEPKSTGMFHEICEGWMFPFWTLPSVKVETSWNIHQLICLPLGGLTLIMIAVQGSVTMKKSSKWNIIIIIIIIIWQEKQN